MDKDTKPTFVMIDCGRFANLGADMKAVISASNDEPNNKKQHPIIGVVRFVMSVICMSVTLGCLYGMWLIDQYLGGSISFDRACAICFGCMYFREMLRH